MRVGAVLLLITTAGALRLPPPNPGQGARPSKTHALPPAAVRDVAAEACTAANALRRDVLPLLGTEAQKPLVLMAVRQGAFQLLVGEVRARSLSAPRRQLFFRSRASA